MHANKHEFGRAITPVSATNGAQRIERPTKPRRRGCAGACVKKRNSGTTVYTNAATTTLLLRNVAGGGRILRLRLIGPAF